MGALPATIYLNTVRSTVFLSPTRRTIMDGIDEPGPNLWESPDDSKKAELGIVALWADTNAGVDKQTWVLKTMSDAQHFLHEAGPPGLTRAVWKKGKRSEYLHPIYVDGTKAPPGAAPYGKAKWEVKPKGGGVRAAPSTTSATGQYCCFTTRF